MKIDPSILSEFKERIDLMNKFQNQRRQQDDIISDIKTIIQHCKKTTFIPFLLQMINSIHLRYSSKTLENLMSPLKQFSYVIDLYFSLNHDNHKNVPEEKDWIKMTELLLEMEMSLFGDIGFHNAESENFEFDKVNVSLKAFFDYFSNAQLSYDEQTLRRLKTNFEKFDIDIQKEFGFNTHDIITFCFYVNDLTHDKLNLSLNPLKDPKKLENLMSNFKGISVD